MAGLNQKKNGVYNVNWHFEGRLFNRSTGTTDEKKARLVQRRVEDTLFKLQNSLILIPVGSDASEFVLSGGRLSEEAKPLPAKSTTLEELFNKYSANLAIGAKEENTLYTERIHRNHILRLMGKDRSVATIDRSVAQSYVKSRTAEGRKPYTIGKELKTLRMIWTWSAKWGGMSVGLPDWQVRDLSFPKEGSKHPFQTYDQIMTKIQRGGLTPAQEEELWDCLFLRSEEIADLLEYVRECDPATHAVISFAALTGARRSEIVRSQIEDFDFKNRSITVREKKRTKGDSYRSVDMHRNLEEVLKDFFQDHPGGQFAFCNPDRSPINKDQATNRFRKAIRGHEKFGRLRGWHVLRHSFISVLCQKGVDQRIISLYVGHQTKEMEERYRHLIPDTVDRPIDKLLA